MISVRSTLYFFCVYILSLVKVAFSFSFCVFCGKNGYEYWSVRSLVLLFVVCAGLLLFSKCIQVFLANFCISFSKKIRFCIVGVPKNNICHLFNHSWDWAWSKVVIFLNFWFFSSTKFGKKNFLKKIVLSSTSYILSSLIVGLLLVYVESCNMYQFCLWTCYL